MKKSIALSLIIFIVAFMGVSAQNVTKLWMAGTAIPCGPVELENVGNGVFKYYGQLRPGTFRIQTKERASSSTYYVSPTVAGTNIIGKSQACSFSSSSSSLAWTVVAKDDYYRITVYTSGNNKTLTGEIFTPWPQLYLAGGAAACGWEAHVMLPFTRSESDINEWEWIGELKRRPENEQPTRFKLLGQDNWDPKHLHPMAQDTPAEGESNIVTGGDDNKWAIKRDGYYRLRVNVFREKFSAVYLGTDLSAIATPDVEDVDVSCSGNAIRVTAPAPVNVEIYDAGGKLASKASGTSTTQTIAQPGVYVVKVEGPHIFMTKKVKIG